MSSTITFHATAGVLTRGQLRRAIKKYAYAHNYQIQVDEDKGLLDSLFKFTLTVPDAEQQRVLNELQSWAQRWDDD